MARTMRREAEQESIGIAEARPAQKGEAGEREPDEARVRQTIRRRRARRRQPAVTSTSVTSTLVVKRLCPKTISAVPSTARLPITSGIAMPT